MANLGPGVILNKGILIQQGPIVRKYCVDASAETKYQCVTFREVGKCKSGKGVCMCNFWTGLQHWLIVVRALPPPPPSTKELHTADGQPNGILPCHEPSSSNPNCAGNIMAAGAGPALERLLWSWAPYRWYNFVFMPHGETLWVYREAQFAVLLTIKLAWGTTAP